MSNSTELDYEDYRSESPEIPEQQLNDLKLDDEQDDDVIIAVMGSTGTGKSSFIKLLTGDTDIVIGNSLESETSDVQVFRFLDTFSGRNVTLVDTPGFDDSRAGVTDTEILKKITNFLLNEYDNERKLKGLIYLQRISDPRFGGQSSRNLRMFRSLCGTDNYKNVVVLTTFWDRLEKAQDGMKREAQLKSQFFKELVDGQAVFMQHNRTRESALTVLEHIFTLVPTTVKIQEEIRVEGKSLEDTAAGSVHREEVERIIAKHKQEVSELKVEMNAMAESNVTMRQELEEERAKLQKELERWEKERSELKEGLEMEQKAVAELRADAEAEKQNHVKWREEKEREWMERLDAQQKSHDEALRKVQAQFEKDKKTDNEGDLSDDKRRLLEAEKRAAEAEKAKNAAERELRLEQNKSFTQRGTELAEKIPLVPRFLAKAYLGSVGARLDLAKRAGRGS